MPPKRKPEDDDDEYADGQDSPVGKRGKRDSFGDQKGGAVSEDDLPEEEVDEDAEPDVHPKAEQFKAHVIARLNKSTAKIATALQRLLRTEKSRVFSFIVDTGLTGAGIAPELEADGFPVFVLTGTDASAIFNDPSVAGACKRLYQEKGAYEILGNIYDSDQAKATGLQIGTLEDAVYVAMVDWFTKLWKKVAGTEKLTSGHSSGSKATVSRSLPGAPHLDLLSGDWVRSKLGGPTGYAAEEDGTGHEQQQPAEGQIQLPFQQHPGVVPHDLYQAQILQAQLQQQAVAQQALQAQAAQAQALQIQQQQFLEQQQYAQAQAHSGAAPEAAAAPAEAAAAPAEAQPQ